MRLLHRAVYSKHGRSVLPKKIDGFYSIRVEIAAVASLLRNDMPGVFLLHVS